MKPEALKYKKQFEKVLKKFGFKNQNGGTVFENHEKGWIADILDRGNYCDVWMAGLGLRSSGFLGGWVYGSATELEEELTAKN